MIVILMPGSNGGNPRCNVAQDLAGPAENGVEQRFLFQPLIYADKHKAVVRKEFQRGYESQFEHSRALESVIFLSVLYLKYFECIHGYQRLLFEPLIYANEH